jgi:uncharacterized integral membrane protein
MPGSHPSCLLEKEFAVRREHGKLLVGLILAGLAVLFILQNTEIVEVHLLFWKLSTSRALMILTVLAIGMAAGWFLHSWTQRKKLTAP